MNEMVKTKFGIQIDKMLKPMWSFGACLSHSEFETYLFINLFNRSNSIGKLIYDCGDNDDWDEKGEFLL